MYKIVLALAAIASASAFAPAPRYVIFPLCVSVKKFVPEVADYGIGVRLLPTSLYWTEIKCSSVVWWYQPPSVVCYAEATTTIYWPIDVLITALHWICRGDAVYWSHDIFYYWSIIYLTMAMFSLFRVSSPTSTNINSDNLSPELLSELSPIMMPNSRSSRRKPRRDSTIRLRSSWRISRLLDKTKFHLYSGYSLNFLEVA